MAATQESKEKQGRPPWQDLSFLVAVFIASRFLWTFILPMSEAPDEETHFWVVRFLSTTHRLPAFEDLEQQGAAAIYGSLPPFGYVPHLLFCLTQPAQFMPLLSRCGSILMGTILLICSYKTAALVFPQNNVCRLALPWMIIFHPQLAFLHAYTNNDSTSSSLASLLLLLALQTLQGGFSSTRTVFMGFLGGWLSITKYAGLAVLPAVALATLAGIRLHAVPLSVYLPSCLTALVLFLGTGSWWFIHNATEFGGDFSGTQTMYRRWALLNNKDINYYLAPEKILLSLRWWRLTFFSFWGLFGYMNIYLWRPIYLIYTSFLLLAAGGGIKSTARLIQAIKVRATTDELKTRLIWFTLIACVITNAAASIWASTTNLGGPQGRYFFTSEIPILCLLIAGLYNVGAKTGKYLVITFVAFTAAAFFWSWGTLFLRYGWQSALLTG